MATAAAIINKNWFFSIGTSDVLRGWTLIWNNFNCIVLNASCHDTVTQKEGLILLERKPTFVTEQVFHARKFSDLVDVWIFLQSRSSVGSQVQEVWVVALMLHCMVQLCFLVHKYQSISLWDKCPIQGVAHELLYHLKICKNVKLWIKKSGVKLI